MIILYGFSETDTNENISTKTVEKPSSSGVKNLLDAFEEAGEDRLEHMPDYEQFVSGKDMRILFFIFICNKIIINTCYFV